MKPGDPRWTARIDEEAGAQDPLGMDRVTNRLLEDLMPGITTISPRPRYIAHHLWALRDTAESKNPNSRVQLIRGLYQRERIVLLAGKYHAQSDSNKSHTGLIGSSTAGEMITTDDDTIELDFSFSSNRSGSYGRNYIGPLQTMGLVDTPENADYEEPTERGDRIAAAYGDMADEVSLTELITSGRISFDALDTVAEKICPCAVSNPEAPDRESLRDLYLGRDAPEKFANQAETRCGTLTLMLHIAQLRGDTVPLSADMLVDACYYDTLSVDDRVIPANIPSGVDEAAARWKALRAHDYFGYALGVVLSSWLSYLKQTEEADATLEEFRQRVKSEDTYSLMAERIGLETITSETPAFEISTSLWPETSADALLDSTSPTPVSMTHPTSEYTLDSVLQEAFSNNQWQRAHATWPCLLLSLALRFASPSGPDALAWAWLESHTEDDLSPVRFREHLKRHLTNDMTIGEFIDWILDEYVIARATEIADGKSDGLSATRGYFEKTPTGWQHVRSHYPGHWGARFDSAVSVLRDLALLDPNSSTTELTAAGQEVLDSKRGFKSNAN